MELITVEKEFRLQWDSNLDPTAKGWLLYPTALLLQLEGNYINSRVTSPDRVLAYLKMGMVREHGAPFSY